MERMPCRSTDLKWKEFSTKRSLQTVAGSSRIAYRACHVPCYSNSMDCWRLLGGTSACTASRDGESTPDR